ncbi:Sh3 domain of Nbp2, partial [Nadsonia fulvescens var. elongata DSM 6958]
RAIALFDFEPENDNEYRLTAGHMVWISYRHGQGWLVAEDAITGDTGLVPEEYV